MGCIVHAIRGLLHVRVSNKEGKIEMAIQRIEVTTGPGPRMSRCVVNGDMVYVCGLTASDTSADVKGQTQQILDKIDHPFLYNSKTE